MWGWEAETRIGVTPVVFAALLRHTVTCATWWPPKTPYIPICLPILTELRPFPASPRTPASFHPSHPLPFFPLARVSELSPLFPCPNHTGNQGFHRNANTTTLQTATCT